ncbi:MAG: phosphoribosylglycinamide formyltransferase [Candidatus Omnitrophica bacterium]|nr:phosphoribosylglycinamide formyltransferase [Candidatus Omnitrophota bacterium]
MKTTNIAVFVSGNGSNLQALIDCEAGKGLSGGRIELVVSDNPGAFAVKRAEKAGIPVFVLEKKGYATREAYDKVISGRLKEAGIGLVVLAGFMRILSGWFVRSLEGRIMNIHPSLLPSFKGACGIRDAFVSGTSVTGVTVHFVTEELDSGPVILQEEVSIEKGDTLETLEEKIHKVEHRLYPEAVRLFCEGRIVVEENKVRIRD